jgi:hypothetical protein
MTDEKIVRDFVMAKNRLYDGFMAEAKSIGKKMIEAPRKKRVAKVEKSERKKAEKLLEEL